MAVVTLNKGFVDFKKQVDTELSKLENDLSRVIYLGEQADLEKLEFKIKKLKESENFKEEHETTLRNKFQNTMYTTLYPKSEVFKIMTKVQGQIKARPFTEQLEYIKSARIKHVF